MQIHPDPYEHQEATAFLQPTVLPKVESDPALEQARAFLIRHLSDSPGQRKTIMPWAKSWTSLIHHSFRVEAYTLKILPSPEYKLDGNEVRLVRLAAILHDAGRNSEGSGHAVRSAGIISDWLSGEGVSCALGDQEKTRLLHLIERHSSKREADSDPLVGLLQDADALDEVGAMSIIMSTRWTDADTPCFFHHLAERLEGREQEHGQELLKIMHSDTARSILRQKLRFIGQFSRTIEG